MIPKLPLTALVFMVFGGLWLTLWQAAAIRRWFVVPVLAGAAVFALYDLPDVIIERDGRLVALRDGEGDYYFSTLRSATFSRENWQRTLGQAELLDFGDFPGSDDFALSCDALGCLYKNHNTRLGLIYDPAGFFEDCRRSDIILTSHYAPFSCKDEKIVIDRAGLRKGGAHALYLGDGIRLVSAGEIRGKRPWTVSDQ
jgi:competence protein ComEC